MLTSENSYLKFLHQIQDPNRPTRIIPLPELITINSDKINISGYEPIYYVDLNKRTIEAPEFLSVEYDHNSETVFFYMNRFYDNVDLSTMTCVVQYQNANPNITKGGYIYLVPYIDIYTLAEHDMMIVPWAIEGPATEYAGTITFSLKFYRTSVNVENPDVYEYDYVLNTVPSKSKILHGLNITATTENYFFTSSEVDVINNRISSIEKQLNEDEIGLIYWTVLEDIKMVANTTTDYPEKTINKNNIITDLIIE